jgi:leader peptidase (prepilin peptidase)/N-methyltransferase
MLEHGFIAVMSVFGLLIGSFLNVVIHRLPIMISQEDDCARTAERYNLLVPRSACPKCGHVLTILENIPLLSWLALRGRCAACRGTISWRYPAVELASSLVPLLVATQFSVPVQVVAASVFVWSAIATAMIDLQHQLIPDAISLPLLWGGLLLSTIQVFVSPDAAIVGVAVGYGTFRSIQKVGEWTLRRPVLGDGDIKLFAAMGAWLGWHGLWPAMLIASVLGTVIGLGVLVQRRRAGVTDTAIPFGPLLLIGGTATLVGGDQIGNWFWAFRLF